MPNIHILTKAGFRDFLTIYDSPAWGERPWTLGGIIARAEARSAESKPSLQMQTTAVSAQPAEPSSRKKDTVWDLVKKNRKKISHKATTLCIWQHRQQCLARRGSSKIESHVHSVAVSYCRATQVQGAGGGRYDRRHSRFCCCVTCMNPYQQVHQTV